MFANFPSLEQCFIVSRLFQKVQNSQFAGISMAQPIPIGYLKQMFPKIRAQNLNKFRGLENFS